MSNSETDRCREAERFRRIDAAFRAGDLDALRAAVEDPASIPNGPMPLAVGPCLEYAIYHSPIAFIRTLLNHAEAVRLLLEAGADPTLRTRIDYCETPAKMATKAGLLEISALLDEAEKTRKSRT